MRCVAPPPVVSGAIVMTIINMGDDENYFINSGRDRALVLPTGIYPPLPWGLWRWASCSARTSLLRWGRYIHAIVTPIPFTRSQKVPLLCWTFSIQFLVRLSPGFSIDEVYMPPLLCSALLYARRDYHITGYDDNQFPIAEDKSLLRPVPEV